MKFSKYIYAEEFEGAAKETNFKVVEEEIDENLKDNGKISNIMRWSYIFVIRETTEFDVSVQPLCSSLGVL